MNCLLILICSFVFAKACKHPSLSKGNFSMEKYQGKWYPMREVTSNGGESPIGQISCPFQEFTLTGHNSFKAKLDFYVLKIVHQNRKFTVSVPDASKGIMTSNYADMGVVCTDYEQWAVVNFCYHFEKYVGESAVIMVRDRNEYEEAINNPNLLKCLKEKLNSSPSSGKEVAQSSCSN